MKENLVCHLNRKRNTTSRYISFYQQHDVSCNNDKFINVLYIGNNATKNLGWKSGKVLHGIIEYEYINEVFIVEEEDNVYI